MLYSDKELNKVEEILEREESSRLISLLDGIIGDEDLPNASDLLEFGISQYRKKLMYIVKVRIHTDGNFHMGYGIEVETNDGSLDIPYFYKVSSVGAPIDIVLKLGELSEMGYRLHGTKSEIKDVFLG